MRQVQQKPRQLEPFLSQLSCSSSRVDSGVACIVHPIQRGRVATIATWDAAEVREVFRCGAGSIGRPR